MNERLRNNEIFGMQVGFDRLYADSKNGSSFYHLYDKITCRNNILLAYRNLRREMRAGKKDISGKMVSEFDAMTDDQLVCFVQGRLANYQPGWVRRITVQGNTGRKHSIGECTIADRLVQQCFLQVLEPVAEARFYKHSYGYRPCRSAIHALSRAVSLVNRGKMYYCVDADIEPFFESIDHGCMMRRLWSFGIRDKRVLSVIRKMLESPVVGAGSMHSGVMQCGVLAPLLFNIYLDGFDHWIETQWEQFPAGINIHVFHNTTGKRSGLKSGYLVRYAGAVKILCRSYDDAWRFSYAAHNYLHDNLFGTMEGNSFPVVNLKKKSVDFLGFNIKAIQKGNTKNGWIARTRMSDTAVKSVSKNLKHSIRDIQYHSFDTRYVQRYNAAVTGVKNYYQYATDVYCDLDKIGMSVSLVIKNRLKDRGRWSVFGEQDAVYRNRNTGIRHDTRVMVVQGMPLDIINGVAHRSPMNFQQDMTPYTKAGREKMGHEGVRVREDYLRYIADTMVAGSEPVEYVNNRLSRYVY